MTQLRSLYLLLGECVELGRDPIVWRRRLAEGLVDLIPDSVALVYELHPSRQAEGLIMPALIDEGWPDESNRGAFLEYLDSGDASENPLLNEIMRENSNFVAVRATSLLPLQEWHSLAFSSYVRQAGLDIDCATTASAHGKKRNVLTVHKYAGMPDITPREETLIMLLHRELHLELGTSLASFGEPSVLELRPSVRVVLFGLLQGESIKETALRIGLSVHTVRDYTKQIHRHFGVTSRSELIADLGGLARSPHGERLSDG